MTVRAWRESENMSESIVTLTPVLTFRVKNWAAGGGIVPTCYISAEGKREEEKWTTEDRRRRNTRDSR